MRQVVRRMYRARRTLVVKFDNDSIDESEDVREVSTAAAITTLHSSTSSVSQPAHVL
jgi:hypothetical protein